jgi:hypothetical protein
MNKSSQRHALFAGGSFAQKANPTTDEHGLYGFINLKMVLIELF